MEWVQAGSFIHHPATLRVGEARVIARRVTPAGGKSGLQGQGAG